LNIPYFFNHHFAYYQGADGYIDVKEYPQILGYLLPPVFLTKSGFGKPTLVCELTIKVAAK